MISDDNKNKREVGLISDSELFYFFPLSSLPNAGKTWSAANDTAFSSP